MKKRDEKNRLFVQLGDRPLVIKSIRLDPEQVKKLEAMCQCSETFGDKVREAIAFYLQSHQ
ncbi:hypothetical protein [Nostoc piscinale]|uniref:hypothetical protein n=1 Tax=Nostoc piscinale TaxID=224012 RepID=UPI0011875EBD|nr:hypothetical protein [Nostoc piscinale]